VVRVCRATASAPWRMRTCGASCWTFSSAETVSTAGGVDGPTEDELFPIFAEGGLKPEDLVEGIAGRYAEYLKEQRPQI